jgi:hypothetical protein
VSGPHVPAFRYSPGDGHLYTWDGEEFVAVSRIGHDGDRLTFHLTGDAIPAPVNRTATALMAAVDQWRFQDPD